MRLRARQASHERCPVRRSADPLHEARVDLIVSGSGHATAADVTDPMPACIDPPRFPALLRLWLHDSPRVSL